MRDSQGETGVGVRCGERQLGDTGVGVKCGEGQSRGDRCGAEVR